MHFVGAKHCRFLTKFKKPAALLPKLRMLHEKLMLQIVLYILRILRINTVTGVFGGHLVLY